MLKQNAPAKSVKTKRTSSKNNNLQIKDWVKLDNAALIYPSCATEKWNFVFRVSAFIDREINPEILQQALNTIMPRFPHFNVCLRKGMFWYYFQALGFYPTVQQEAFFPCRIMDFSPNKHIFRVLYYKNKISFEAFHALTDGFGTLVFMVNLIAAYYNLIGVPISLSDYVIDYNDKPALTELEDPFARIADKSITRSRKESRRRRIYGTPLEHGKLHVTIGELSLANIKQVAKSNNISITELMVASLFKALIAFESPLTPKHFPLKISVPINARAYFPTSSTRNFSSYINVELKPEFEHLSVQEIALIVREQLKAISKEFVHANINQNVQDQNNIFVRMMPLFIKNLALNLSYRMVGEGLQTSVFSNIGQVALPNDLKPLIKRIDAIIGASKYNPILLCSTTVGDNMSLTFSSTIVETVIQREFFRLLSSLGAQVKIDTNMVD